MCQGFGHFSGFLQHFVLAKLAISSIRVKKRKSARMLLESSDKCQDDYAVIGDTKTVCGRRKQQAKTAGKAAYHMTPLIWKGTDRCNNVEIGVLQQIIALTQNLIFTRLSQTAIGDASCTQNILLIDLSSVLPLESG